MMWKRRIGENLGNESLQLNSEIPEILALTLENSENFRKLEPSQTLKLLPASTDDSNRKQIRTGSSPQTKERRKVRLMEQPGQRMAGRSSQVARTMATTSQSRPLSADDIQKAKIRAMHLQSKYGKTSSPSHESRLQKTEKPIKFLTSQKSNLLSVHEILRPRIEEDKEPSVLASKTSLLKAHSDPELSLNPRGSSMDMLKRGQIPWQKPPEMRINSLWGIATGEKSKEVEIQTQRIRREKETIYHRIHEIPYNPKEPWDREMDYDDTLTPIIPSQQQPEPDGADKLPSPRYIQNSAEASSTTSVPTSNENATSQANISNENVPEPDFELLAVLLKNPELVFALTSAQGNNFSSEDTVKLLEMIKGSGFGLNGLLNASSSGKSPEKMEITSLPSPTPSTSIMSEWRPEVAHFPGVSTTSQLPEKFPATNLGLSQNPTFNNFTLPQVPSLVAQSSHQLPARMNQQPMQTFPAIQLPEKVSFGDIHNVKPAKVSIVLNPPKRPTITLPQFPGLLRPPARPPQLSPSPPLYPSWTNNYNVFPRGPGQPQVRPGRAWEGNEFANEPEFESWSPENSPVRSPEYRYRRNFVGPRRGSGRNSRPDWSRQRNFSEQRDHREGNRRWRDRRR